MSVSQAQLAWPLQKPQQLVYIELGPDNGGMMLGICEQGFSFRAVSPLRLEGPVSFTFALDGKTRLQGTGEIVWSEEGGKTGGLKFTGVSAEFRESLRLWLASEATPKNVGREITPAAALPLDAISKEKAGIRSSHVEESKAAVPHRPVAAPRLEPKPAKQAQPKQIDREVEAQIPPPVLPPEINEKPPVPKPVEPKPSAPAQLPESTPLGPKPVKQAQPKQIDREVEAQLPPPAFAPESDQESAVPKPSVPTLLPEVTTPEPKPGEQIQSRPATLEVEAPVAPPSRSHLPVEQEPVELKPVEPRAEPLANAEQEPHPIAPEPELQTAAPLPPARPQTESIFSLPNFRLPSASVLPASSVETVAAPTKFSPVEPTPAAPIPSKIPHPEPPLPQPARFPAEIEIPVPPNQTTLSDLFAKDLEPEPPRFHRAAAALIIGLALAMILAALALSFRKDVGAALVYLGEKIAGEDPRHPSTRQPFSNSAPAQSAQPNGISSEKGSDQPAAQSLEKSTTSQPQLSSDATRTAASQTPSANTENSVNANSSPSGSPSANLAQQVPSSSPPTDGGTGQKEFEQARAILKGNHRRRDLSYAVDLLWLSVGKGHVPAEVTLADLYARGDGVEKSCVQARTLLEAAVRKGSPEGRHRLDLLRRSGCR